MTKIKKIALSGLKICVASTFAIMLAEFFELSFSVSAGIVAILAIAPTKRETLKTALRRLFAFVIALFIAYVMYGILGYNYIAFSIYLLIFAMFCNAVKCENAIAMNSVLISHFLTFEMMNVSTICNELMLFLIGTTSGILVNLHLRKKTEYMELLKNETDEQIKIILLRMAENISIVSSEDYNGDCFVKLDNSIKKAKKIARENYMNQLINSEKSNTLDMEYVIMREQQIKILRNIYKHIKNIKVIPNTAVNVSEYFKKVYENYNKNTLPIDLIDELHELYEILKNSPLPKTREEFEARAELYIVIVEIEECLMLKVKFYEEFHEQLSL